MSQQVILENDPILKAVIQKLTEKNYLETKYPLLNRGEIIGVLNIILIYNGYTRITTKLVLTPKNYKDIYKNGLKTKKQNI